MNKKSEIDYGVLTDVSKAANCNLFGDCSGSTISRRTTRGFKKAFNLSDDVISDQNAEHIIHGVMGATVACLASKSDEGKVGGLLLLAGLAYCYHND